MGMISNTFQWNCRIYQTKPYISWSIGASQILGLGSAPPNVNDLPRRTCAYEAAILWRRQDILAQFLKF